MSERRQTRTEEEWNEQINLISQLYVVEGLTYNDIAERLKQLDFDTTGASIKNRLSRWNVKRRKPEEELRLLARHLLHLQDHGQTATFEKFGEAVAHHKVIDYIQRNPTTKASDDSLPAYIQVIMSDLGGLSNATGERDNSLGQSMAPSDAPVGLSDSIESLRQSNRPAKKRKHARSSQIESNCDVAGPSRHQNDREDNVLERQQSDDLHDDPVPADQRRRMVADRNRWSREQISQQIDFVNQGPGNNLQMFAAMVQSRGNISPYGESTDLGPLHMVARINDKKHAEQFLRLGANVNARGGLKYTPLHTAAMYGSFDVLRLFLQQENVDVNAIDAAGATPLLYTILGRPCKCDPVGGAPALECALLLIRNEADADLGAFNGKTVLHLACAKEGLGKLVRSITEKTTRLNDQDKDGRTAIHTAIWHKNEDYVDALMQAGADLTIPDIDGETPMHTACLYASADTVSRMIAEDVSFTAKNCDDETILHLACKRQLYDIAAEIAEKPGVDINAKSRGGATPVIIAAASGQLDTVRMLVEKGADLRAMDEALNTALKSAIENKHDQIIEYLADKSPLEPVDQTVKKWRVEHEHDRRVQQALSVPTDKAFTGHHHLTQMASEPPIRSGRNDFSQVLHQARSKGKVRAQPLAGIHGAHSGEPAIIQDNIATNLQATAAPVMLVEPSASWPRHLTNHPPLHNMAYNNANFSFPNGVDYEPQYSFPCSNWPENTNKYGNIRENQNDMGNGPMNVYHDGAFGPIYMN